MRSLPIVCYHGSPGLPDDFKLLEKFLPELQLVKLTRKGYGNGDVNFSGDSVILGYSWGVIDAILSADEKPKSVKGIILVSPYAFPQPKVGWIKKAILNTPFVSDLILAAAGGKVISKMLVDTSYPLPVPKEYQNAAKQLVRPKIVRTALAEKSLDRNNFELCLKRVGNLHIPVAIIWGAEDRVGRPSEQIDPLRAHISFNLEKELLRAGHAIVWTHPQDLAVFVRTFIDRINRGTQT